MSDMSYTQDIIIGLTARRLHSFVIGPDLKLLVTDIAKVELISTLPLLDLLLGAVEEEVTIALETIIGSPYSPVTAITSSDREQYDKELVLGYTARRLKHFIRSPILAQIVGRVRNLDYSGDLLPTVAQAVLEELSDELKLLVSKLIVHKDKDGVTQASPKEDMNGREIAKPMIAAQLHQIPFVKETQQLLGENVATVDGSNIPEKLEKAVPEIITEQATPEVTTTTPKVTGLAASRWSPANRKAEKNKSAVLSSKSPAFIERDVYKEISVELGGLAASRWAPTPGQTKSASKVVQAPGGKPGSHRHMSQWRRTKP